MTENVLLTVKQFAASQPALSDSGVRWAVFNQDFNGLSKSGAIIRAGTRVLIDPTLYLTWLQTNPKLSPPGIKPRRPRPVPILDVR